MVASTSLLAGLTPMAQTTTARFTPRLDDFVAMLESAISAASSGAPNASTPPLSDPGDPVGVRPTSLLGTSVMSILNLSEPPEPTADEPLTEPLDPPAATEPVATIAAEPDGTLDPETSVAPQQAADSDQQPVIAASDPQTMTAGSKPEPGVAEL
jgi:hypothetical protein